MHWSVLGLHQDLSARHPVPPLLGAYSAQAELALTGQWSSWPSVVASVLVQSGDRRASKTSDMVVQLSTLDTGPLGLQFSATYGLTGPEVAMPAGSSEGGTARVEALLHPSSAVK